MTIKEQVAILESRGIQVDNINILEAMNYAILSIDMGLFILSH